jgi:hypothetical protein
VPAPLQYCVWAAGKEGGAQRRAVCEVRQDHSGRGRSNTAVARRLLFVWACWLGNSLLLLLLLLSAACYCYCCCCCWQERTWHLCTRMEG